MTVYPYHLDPRHRQLSDLPQERQAEIHDEIADSIAAVEASPGHALIVAECKASGETICEYLRRTARESLREGLDQGQTP